MIELYHYNIWCMCGCYADDMIFLSEICVRVAWTVLYFCLCGADSVLRLVIADIFQIVTKLLQSITMLLRLCLYYVTFVLKLCYKVLR